MATQIQAARLFYDGRKAIDFVAGVRPKCKSSTVRPMRRILDDVAGISQDQLKGMPADTAPNLESLFNQLQAGRTDIVIDARSSYCKAKMMGLDKVVMLEPPLEKLLGYHWLSVRHRALIPRLDAVLKKMKREDTIKKLQDDAWRDFNAQCRV